MAPATPRLLPKSRRRNCQMVMLQASIPPRLRGMEGRRTCVRVMPDLVDAIRQEIDARLDELRPRARGASDLHRALDALSEYRRSTSRRSTATRSSCASPPPPNTRPAGPSWPARCSKRSRATIAPAPASCRSQAGCSGPLALSMQGARPSRSCCMVVLHTVKSRHRTPARQLRRRAVHEAGRRSP
jgi:hypothetical protein